MAPVIVASEAAAVSRDRSVVADNASGCVRVRLPSGVAAGGAPWDVGRNPLDRASQVVLTSVSHALTLFALVRRRTGFASQVSAKSAALPACFPGGGYCRFDRNSIALRVRSTAYDEKLSRSFSPVDLGAEARCYTSLLPHLFVSPTASPLLVFRSPLIFNP